MNQQDTQHLQDLLAESQKAISIVEGRSREDLDFDLIFADAAAMRIIVIGELANKVSDPIQKQYSSIPWSQIIGMRNRLAHDRANTSHDKVWAVFTCHLPDLVAQLEQILIKVSTDVTV